MTDETPKGENDQTEIRPEPDRPSSQSGARFEAGQVLAERYRIVAPLGRGGMGEVYRAEDMRLDQQVALKFLTSSAAADQGMIDRLIGEVRIGRQVSHPNVCRLYDLVEAPGQLYFITMEFVDGEDLASLLRRIGRVTGDKAISLSHDICAGLSAAHQLGVIHRDLKPANVMVDGRGHARITDFGLAVGHRDPRRSELAGTPAYMAPEQLAGDQPSIAGDIYALGAVLFETFTGQRLFDARTIDETRRLHLQPKPSMTAIAWDVDPEVERLILSCLEEKPERRPGSVREVMEQLPTRSRATPAPARVSTRDSASSGERKGRSLAVLPFEDLSAGTDEDHFSIGLAEEIISDLAKLRSLRVISRGSVMRYRGARDLTSVARELGVAYVLSGSIRRAGDRLRITTNLVDGRTDIIIWSDKFNGTIDDIFDIQETVARTVAERLEVALTEEEAAGISARPIPNALAYEYYLKARGDIQKFTAEGLDRALSDLERGLEAVGENVLIYSAMAQCHWQFFNAGIDPDEKRLDRAESLALKIAEIDPNSAHVDRIRGFVGISRGDVRGGITDMYRAVKADPTDTDTLGWLTFLLLLTGQTERGTRMTKRLERIDPLGQMSLWSQVFSQSLEGRFGEAIRLAERAREVDPEAAPAAFIHGELLAMAGAQEKALLMFQEAQQRWPGTLFTSLGVLEMHALRGEKEKALEILSEIEQPAWNDLQYPIHVAGALVLIGENDRALEWLDNGRVRGYGAHEYLSRHCSFLSSLRDEPRFGRLIERMKDDVTRTAELLTSID